MHATQVWREQYFTKYDKARQEIEKRVRSIIYVFSIVNVLDNLFGKIKI
jgi:hypothetical protein